MLRVIIVLEILLSAISVAISLYCLKTKFSWIASSFISIALLSSILLLIYFFTWKIQVDIHTFKVCRPFSHTCVFNKRDVIGLKEGAFFDKLYIDREYVTILRLNFFVSGKKEFIADLDNYYNENTKCSYGIPEMAMPLFGGYVRNPAEFICVFSFVNLFLIGGICLLLFLTFPKDSYSECRWVTLSRYTLSWEDGQLNLHDPETQQTFYANYLDAAISDKHIEQINLELCQDTEVCILVDTKSWERALAGKSDFVPILEIKNMVGDIILNRKDIRSGKLVDFYKGATTSVVILVCMATFEILFFYVISHAPKYPHLFRLFVRKEYRNI